MQSIRVPFAFPPRRSVPVRFPALLILACVLGCGGSGPRPASQVDPEWRLVPEGTALGERRQFFLYGRHLDSAAIAAPPSVKVETGPVQADGRALPLYLTVGPLPGPMRGPSRGGTASAGTDPAPGETPGSREIRVRTADTALVFKLKVVDETLPR